MLCVVARVIMHEATAEIGISTEKGKRRRSEAVGHGFDPEKFEIHTIAIITAISAATFNRGGLIAMVKRRS